MHQKKLGDFFSEVAFAFNFFHFQQVVDVIVFDNTEAGIIGTDLDTK